MVVLSHWLIGPSFTEGQVVGASTYTCSSWLPSEIFGVAESICSARAGFPLALFWGLD